MEVGRFFQLRQIFHDTGTRGTTAANVFRRFVFWRYFSPAPGDGISFSIAIN